MLLQTILGTKILQMVRFGNKTEIQTFQWEMAPITLEELFKYILLLDHFWQLDPHFRPFSTPSAMCSLCNYK